MTMSGVRIHPREPSVRDWAASTFPGSPRMDEHTLWPEKGMWATVMLW